MTNVLIVDDQPQVRQVLERLLTADGYAVQAVPDAETALQIVRAGSRVDVLVTDLLLPKMTGRDLVAQLGDAPDLKVLYISGQTDAAETGPILRADRSAFLPKPFTRTQLLELIHALVGPAGVTSCQSS